MVEGPRSRAGLPFFGRVMAKLGDFSAEATLAMAGTARKDNFE
jgi:hypothetical protein